MPHNTCKKEVCIFAKKVKIKYKNCPFYVEALWAPEDEKDPIMIEDCAIVRGLLMIQDLHNKFVGLQQSQEELRNQAHAVNLITADVMDHARKQMGIPDDQKIYIGDNE